MTTCTIALDPDTTCDRPAVVSWQDFGQTFGLCVEHDPDRGRVLTDERIAQYRGITEGLRELSVLSAA